MPKKTYTTEDKLNALRICDEIGVLKASEETGITTNTLYAWRRKKDEAPAAIGGTGDVSLGTPAIGKKRDNGGRKQSNADESAHDELVRLRIEIEALKKQNRTLKDALRVFTE